MPYTHYTMDERNALQAMEGMGLPKSYSAVILGKHPSSIYCELDRNGTGCVYTGNEAHKASVQRRPDNKPSPKLDDPVLRGEIMRLFNKTCLRTRFQDGLRRSILDSRKSRLQYRPSTPVSTTKRRKTLL